MKSSSITSPKKYDQDSKRKKPLQYMVLLEGHDEHRERFTANANCTVCYSLHLEKPWAAEDGAWK